MIVDSRHWGLNPRPPHYKCDALPLSYSGHNANIIATGGIRTHEACAEHLKCSPFDRSGTVAYFFMKID